MPKLNRSKAESLTRFPIEGMVRRPVRDGTGETIGFEMSRLPSASESQPAGQKR